MLVLMTLAGFIVPTKPVDENVGAVKKFTDYKFWYITRDDNGFIIEATIRFYEGHYEMKMVEENDGTFVEKPVYIRDKKLDIIELGHLKNNKFRKEKNGTKTIVYTINDFGTIKTDDELRVFLDKQIVKDKGRQVIPEQKIQ